MSMFMNEPQKIEVLCPECGEKTEVLWFPSNKIKFEVAGSRAGKSTLWAGRGEKVEGKCKCGYKFKPDDLD